MVKRCAIFYRQLSVLFIVLGSFYSGISQELKGRVLNSEGFPVVAATVRAYPSGNFAVTDEEGFFLITGNGNASFLSLEVSHVAYTQMTIELSDNLGSPLEIVLKDAVTGLDEVVVVQPRILQKGS